MRHIKLLGLCIVAVLATCSAVVGEASAAPEHIYKVEGKKLEATEEREIKASAKTELVLKGKGSLSIEWVLKCKKLKLNVAARPTIRGGTPGTSAKEIIEFEECTATVGEAKCAKVTIEGKPLKDELVTIVLPAGKAGKLAMLFTPETPETLWNLILTKCGIFGSLSGNIYHNTAAWINPEKSEQVALALIWNEKELITEIEKQNKEKITVGLGFGTSPATINGEAAMELLSGQVWGAF